MYNDSAVVTSGLSGAGGAAGGGGSAGGLVSDGLIKYVGLGGLALVSVAMMLMMVRKASVREQLPTAEELVGIPPALARDSEMLVGEAAEGETPLEGIEVDDAALRRDEMLQQINNAARETPEELAALLRKWIRAEE
jgi:flagellar biosynthesis/type III secretory pathway M-ring protein FliF/YscJ